MQVDLVVSAPGEDGVGRQLPPIAADSHAGVIANPAQAASRKSEARSLT